MPAGTDTPCAQSCRCLKRPLIPPLRALRRMAHPFCVFSILKHHIFLSICKGGKPCNIKIANRRCPRHFRLRVPRRLAEGGLPSSRVEVAIPGFEGSGGGVGK